MTQSLGPVGETRPDSLTRYLVELSDSESLLEGVQALAGRARRAAAQVTQEGTRVRFLRVVFVPDDGSCFLLYEAESEQAINKAIASGEIRVRRVARTLEPTDLTEHGDTGRP